MEPAERLRQRRAELQAYLGMVELVMADLDRRAWADAEREKTELAIDAIDMALLQSAQTEAIERDTNSREALRLEAENAAFWDRRFMVSLQVGNGAGFLATVGAVFQAPIEAAAMWAGPATLISGFFGVGTIAAGMLPSLAGIQTQAPAGSRIWRMARYGMIVLVGIACGAFGGGTVTVVQAIGRVAEQPPKHAADPAPPSPSPAPSPPAGGPSGSPDG
jgi:hypothetical protein